tara:strand:+ start:53 stop:451 length:399 start_codon:yes stop_codon:yes gene_type:complete
MIQGVRPNGYKWSRASYVMVAAAIADLYQDTDCPTIWDTLAKFGAIFATDNPRFDVARFRTAALKFTGEQTGVYDHATPPYERGDFLLMDSAGHIQAVSGNSDFWDDNTTAPGINESDYHMIVKVLEVNDNA